jgi:hypothetical protein
MTISSIHNRAVILILAGFLAVSGMVSGCKKRPRQRSLPANAGLTGGELLFSEDFSGDLSAWTVESKNWKIKDGRLYTGNKSNKNKGTWLKDVSLPKNVRMEFEATSVKGDKPTFEGDFKFEFGGEKSEHAAGYIIILGGWKNTINTIARGDEHGKGRLAVDERFKVEEDKTYKIQVIRLNGEIKWFVDGKLLLRVKDKNPAQGGAFGFNDWSSRVYFDNLRIYAL